MADQTVGVTDQNTAGIKKVDVSEFTRSDGTVIERQRVILGDAEGGETSTGGLASVHGEFGRGELRVDTPEFLLAEINSKLGDILDLLKLTLEG